MTNVKTYILDRCEPVPESGCWIWTGPLLKSGYGAAKINGKSARAHRAAYSEFVGSIRSGAMILHRCDTPCCINPAHLYAGTALDNMSDRAQRHAGSNYNTIPEDGVTHIRTSGLPSSVLAKMYGVTMNHISRIKTFKRRAY